MEGLDFWYLYVGVFGVAIFALLGIYSAIVRSFNEDYLLRISIATFIQIVGLYAVKKLGLAFIPMSIPLMYGFVLFFLDVVEPCCNSLCHTAYFCEKAKP